MRLHRQRDIVERGEIAKDAGDLERAGDAESGAADGTKPRDIAAGEMDRPGVGMQFADELRDQRCLAGAVGPDHGMDLAGRDSERHLAGREESAKALGQRAGFEERLGHSICEGWNNRP